jgi:hypothetical protein
MTGLNPTNRMLMLGVTVRYALKQSMSALAATRTSHSMNRVKCTVKNWLPRQQARQVPVQSTLMAGFFVKKPAFPGPFFTQQPSQPVASTSAAPPSSIPQLQVPTEAEPIDVDSFSDTTMLPMPPSAASHILIRLRALTSYLPNSVLVASPDDVFACFVHDPRGEVEEGQDPYETTVDRTLRKHSWIREASHRCCSDNPSWSAGYGCVLQMGQDLPN